MGKSALPPNSTGLNIRLHKGLVHVGPGRRLNFHLPLLFIHLRSILVPIDRPGRYSTLHSATMHTRLLNFTWVVIPICAAVALAQDINPNVVGCSTVGCPSANITGSCKVANETFIGIGVAPIISDNSSFPLLSWVQGSSSEDQKAAISTNTDAFYLATPPGLAMGGANGTQACALFFRQVNATMPGDDVGTATGTCVSAIQQSCIDSLVDRARNLKVADGTDACGALLQEFTTNFDDACASYSTGNKWQALTATGKKYAILCVLIEIVFANIISL